MNILSLESSGRPASAELWRDGHRVAALYQDRGYTHSRTLLCLCSSLFATAEISPRELDIIAVSAGPGSFTGVRIGVATAKGLSFGCGASCLAVSSLLGLACGCASMEGALLCPCTDARCGRVYNALFRVENSFPRRLCEDRVIPTESLASELAGQSPYLLGDGAAIAAAAMPAARLLPEAFSLPSAHGIALAAERLKEKAVPGELLAPIYLQRSQAEQTRLEREASKAKE